MALKWLAASVTQGSNDAFAQSEFNTGLSNVTRSAFRIRRIEWFMPQIIGADSNVDLVLRRNSASAVTFYSTEANPVIGAKRFVCELTTSGMSVVSQVQVDTYDRDLDLLIVEEQLYLNIDTNGTSTTNTGVIRIGYEVRTITENERLSIQASTASG